MGAQFCRKFSVLLVVNHRADEVRRQQIRGELEALKIDVQTAAQRLNRQRFRQTGDALQQNVTIRQQPDQ